MVHALKPFLDLRKAIIETDALIIKTLIHLRTQLLNLVANPHPPHFDDRISWGRPEGSSARIPASLTGAPSSLQVCHDGGWDILLGKFLGDPSFWVILMNDADTAWAQSGPSA